VRTDRLGLDEILDAPAAGPDWSMRPATNCVYVPGPAAAGGMAQLRCDAHARMVGNGL